jgi:sortase A
MRVLRTSVSAKPRRLRQKGKQFVLKPELWRAWQDPGKPKLPVSGHSRRWRPLSNILILAGGVLCTYVGASYARMYLHQRALLKEWNETSARAKNLTKLSIPRIKLEDIVLEGASQDSLLLGPAHLTGTAAPGSVGNAVIAGHRDTFFRRIHSLHYGDDVYVLRSGKRYHYVVRSRKVVEPTDLSVLRATKDGELTLITCYPTNAIGPAPRRLIVVAKLVAGT